MKVLATLLFLLILTAPTRAQIGMGSDTPHPSAALDVQATDKAFYPPRLTTIQRKAIVYPQPGAFVFDLDKGTFYLFDGVNWLPLSFIPADNSPSIDRTASDGVAGDYFGSSVAISGDYAVVGSPYASSNGNTQQGAAYVFVRTGNTWRQDVKLTNFAGAAIDRFGASVAISGNNVIIGSPYDDVGGNVNQGSAHAFVRSGGGVWSHTQLFASDGAAEDRFGHDVAISGNYALVGSFLDDHTFVDQGSAYIFALTGTGWVQQSKLIASDGAAIDRFGASVAISGNYALVGSDRDDNEFSNQGSAYIFVRSGSSWIQQSKLNAADAFTNDQFGIDVALSGDYALVGSLGGGTGPFAGVGAAYVFVRSGGGWAQQTKPLAPDAINSDNFGRTVALSGEYALVGSPYGMVGNNALQGSAYLYQRKGTSWSLMRKITDNSPAGTRNGASVAIGNGTFIIGGFTFQNRKGKVGFGTVDN